MTTHKIKIYCHVCQKYVFVEKPKLDKMQKIAKELREQGHFDEAWMMPEIHNMHTTIKETKQC